HTTLPHMRPLPTQRSSDLVMGKRTLGANRLHDGMGGFGKLAFFGRDQFEAEFGRVDQRIKPPTVGDMVGYGANIGNVDMRIIRVDRKSTRLNSSHVSISYA